MIGCDCHIHVYDGAYPASPDAVLRPPDASLDDYRALQSTLGTDHVVLVQPTTYGLDNSLHLAAAAAVGDASRLVVVVDGSVSREELVAYTDAGAVGARFHMLPGGAVGWDALEPVAAAVASFGWHIQLQMNGRDLPHVEERLLALPCPVVIDHVGRFMGPVSTDAAAWRSLLRLVEHGAHVKLSAPYESAADPTGEFEQVGACVADLVARAPDRLVWASNWPHPGQQNAPSAAELVRLRDRWLTGGDLIHQVLVTNPSRLYGW